MKKYLNVYYLGFVALGLLAVAFFFELAVPNETVRNVFAVLFGALTVPLVLYVIVYKMILKK